MSAIGNDAPTGLANLDVDDADVGAFLTQLMPDAETPSGSDEEKKKPKAELPEANDSAKTPETDDADAPAEKPEAEGDDEAGEPDKTKRSYADEGVYVKVKVGDEEHEVPVKDLQRLYGQEKALTQKSMEVAEQRRTADAELARNTAATTALLERAKARFEPYSKIDFLLVAQELSPEDYTNLREAAKAAYDEVQFLQNGLTQVTQAAQQRQHDALITQAKETLKVLGGPVEQGGIEGWNEELYNNIRSFATTAGLAPEIVSNLVDPVAIRLLNEARLYRLGASKVITKKVNKTPTQVIKTKTAPEAAAPGDKTNVNKAMKKLRTSGDVDDAGDAFLASWASRDAD